MCYPTESIESSALGRYSFSGQRMLIILKACFSFRAFHCFEAENCRAKRKQQCWTFKNHARQFAAKAVQNILNG